MPLDRFLESSRDAIRSRASDGSVAVVKIDDRSIRSLRWSERGAVNAKLVDSLFALGVRRVVFDQAFSDPSPAGDDNLFAQALRRHYGRVIIGARFEEDRHSHSRSALLPVPVIRGAAVLGSYNVRRDPIGYTTGIPYQSEIGGRRYRSFASLLSGQRGGVDELFEPDFAIEYQTVPAVSLVDVVGRSAASFGLVGKDVFVGSTADSLGDTHMVPRQGPIPGVYIHAIATETLRHARPRQLGWLPAYVAMLALSLAYVGARRQQERLTLAVGGYAALAAVPVLLDRMNIEVELMPAIALLTTIIIRAHLLARRTTNPATGLPTLDRVQHKAATSPATLVGVRLRNYSDLRLSLTDEEERALLLEVVRRLRVAGHDADLMHVDDTFVWSCDLPVARTLLDHVEGLHAILSAPIEAGSRRIDLSFAFGVDGEIDRPLSNRIGGVQLSADQAAATGAKWKVNNAGAIGDAEFRLSLPSQIEHAIAAGEIWVAYQPKLALNPKAITGAEALVRWTHPERGVVRPNEFIPIVEEANRIESLTYFVLETAVRDARRIERQIPGFTVAVNLSVRMLSVEGLVEKVLGVVKRHGLAPQRLTLEVTESLQIDTETGALSALQRLRAAGVGISIDDYGTKFSTLEYVRHLPATEIKIDRQFAEKVHLSAEDAIMVGSTIKLAHDLRLKVVAEGVEHPEAYVKLEELGCDTIQGYLIARPMPIEKLLRFLEFVNPEHAANRYQLANQS